MTKREIKRKLYKNLKDQLQTYKSLDACERYGAEPDVIRTYEDAIQVYDAAFYNLIKLYENCLSD